MCGSIAPTRRASKVRDAGGSVVTEPFDFMDAGRMAAFTDPEGAAISALAGEGAQGRASRQRPRLIEFQWLNTRDLEGARSFYGSVFGWQTLDHGRRG